MNLIEADLAPNIETAQQYTPGELPTYSQGETYAETPPSVSEIGANSNVVTQEYNKPLPESKPPVSPNAPV